MPIDKIAQILGVPAAHVPGKRNAPRQARVNDKLSREGPGEAKESEVRPRGGDGLRMKQGKVWAGKPTLSRL